MIPALFIGHGSPMNALEENEFTQSWRGIASSLPRPEAIVSVSAHWVTPGTQVTGMEHPVTIHDFYGFPEKLNQVIYPATGSPALAEKIRALVRSTNIHVDQFAWGLDHGTWSILKWIYPDALIPVVQLSLNLNMVLRQHLELASELRPLREENILFLCSGNIVHNLSMIRWTHLGLADNGYEWASEFDDWVRKCLETEDIDTLMQYRTLMGSADLAVPSFDHFIPLIYLAGLKTDHEHFYFHTPKVIGGSLSMTSVVLK